MLEADSAWTFGENQTVTKSEVLTQELLSESEVISSLLLHVW